MKNKLQFIVAALISCAASISFAQPSAGTGGASGNYSFTPIPLPFNYLAGSTLTNLANGWQSITSYTNVVQGWDSVNLVLTKTTNVVSVTNTVYADFSAQKSRYVNLQYEFNTSDPSTTAGLAIAYAKSVTGRFDPSQIYWWTNNANGNSLSAENVQIDMGGYGFGRIMQVYWLDSTAGHYLTNGGGVSQGLYFSTKQGASQ